jgi:hypothetical protein
VIVNLVLLALSVRVGSWALSGPEGKNITVPKG